MHISGHKWYTQSTQISQKQDENNIYLIMKRMFPSGYHYNGFVATHTLGHMLNGSIRLMYGWCTVG